MATPTMYGTISDDAEHQKIQAHNDAVFEKVGSPGRYYFIFVPILWLYLATANVTAWSYPVFLSLNATSPNSGGFYGIVNQWHLVGDLAVIPTAMGMILNAGLGIGSSIGGYAADYLGRWKVVLIVTFVRSIVQASAAACRSYQSLMVVVAFQSITAGSSVYIASTYALELVNRKYRFLVEGVCDAISSQGFPVMALVAFLTKRWDWFMLACGILSLVALLPWSFLHESPRWLVQRGKIDKANKVVARIERINGWNLDLKLKRPWPGYADREENKVSVRHTLRKRIYAIRYVVVLFNMGVCGLTNYGIIYNIPNLVGSPYLNMAVMGCINQTVGIITICVNRFFKVKRILFHTVIQCILTSFFLTMAIVHSTNQAERLHILIDVCQFLGGLFTMLNWVISSLFANELFPTMIRHFVYGSAIGAAQIGGITAVILDVYVFDIKPYVPYYVMGAATALAAVVVRLTLPESEGSVLPDDEQDAAKHDETSPLLEPEFL